MISSLSTLQPLFDRLVKRKWLSNPEPLDQIVELIKDHFRKYQRMDGAPYHLLVSEVHRRVLMEYLRALMRGRIICTSSKKRKRMAGRLREEGQHIKVLFKDLVGVWFRVRAGLVFPFDLVGQLMFFPGVSFELVGPRPPAHL